MARRFAHPTYRQRGFTLIEAVMVIVLTGIIGAIVATFVSAPVNAYLDQARRGELSDEADGTLRRIARELQGALPNSVRVDPTGSYLEFVPVRSAGRYRHAPSATSVEDYFDVSSLTDGSFEVLGFPVSALAGDQLVVYNLGQPGADVYAGTSRRNINTTGGALGSVSYDVGGTQFPYASPNHRFHIVSGPVSYVCSPGAGGSGSLRRHTGYAFQAAQPAAGAAPLNGPSGANNALLSGSVAACSFSYNGTASARQAVVTLRLTLTRDDESITLLHQVFVENSP